MNRYKSDVVRDAGRLKKARITADWLRQQGACADQVAIFAQHWPKGATITLRGLHKAARVGLDLDWLAERILNPTAWATYDAARAPAWATYNAARATALWSTLRGER